MASQPVCGRAEVATCQIQSFIRGYHAYKDKWTPSNGEILALRREPNNVVDSLAVAVTKSGEIVGHVPYNIAPLLSKFLKRDVNKAVAEVTGDRVNRGAGYGLEIPCVYKLYGPKAYIDRFSCIVRERDL